MDERVHEYYAAVKEDKVREIMLSKVSEISQRERHCMISFICRI